MAFCADCGKKKGECGCENRSRSRERKEHEKQEPVGGDALLLKLASDFKRTSEASTAQVSGLITGLKHDMGDIKKDVMDIKESIKDAQVKINNHEERIKKIEGKLAGVATLGGVGSGGGGLPGAEFTPNFVEVKGFCTFEEKATKGVTRAEINDFIGKFKNQLLPEQKDWIGQPQIRALKSYKFKVKVNPDMIWEIKDNWANYVNENGILLAGSAPRLIVERSPEAQKIFNKMGATFSKLQKKLLGSGAVVRAEWRQKEFFVKKGVAEEGHLLTINQDLSITWTKEGVEATGISEGVLAAAVA